MRVDCTGVYVYSANAVLLYFRRLSSTNGAFSLPRGVRPKEAAAAEVAAAATATAGVAVILLVSCAVKLV